MSKNLSISDSSVSDDQRQTERSENMTNRSCHNSVYVKLTMYTVIHRRVTVNTT